MNIGKRRVPRLIKCFTGETKTQKHQQDECDINKIMEKFMKTGILGTGTGTRKPLYGDFADGTGYHEAQNALIQANEDFLALPASIRKRFKNDPASLLDFLKDPENLEEAKELGLVITEPETPVDAINNLRDAFTESAEGLEEEDASNSAKKEDSSV